jgi:hypothetical protein
MAQEERLETKIGFSSTLGGLGVMIYSDSQGLTLRIAQAWLSSLGYANVSHCEAGRTARRDRYWKSASHIPIHALLASFSFSILSSVSPPSIPLRTE